MSFTLGGMNLTVHPSTAHSEPSVSDAIAEISCKSPMVKEGPFSELKRD